ncbi:MAG: hypothetical protein V3V85_03080 [Candidatus Thorarchaeota archaeon]
MQVLIVKFQRGSTNQRDAKDFAESMLSAEHGSIVTVPHDIEYELMEIEGDELSVLIEASESALKVVG